MTDLPLEIQPYGDWPWVMHCQDVATLLDYLRSNLEKLKCLDSIGEYPLGALLNVRSLNHHPALTFTELTKFLHSIRESTMMETMDHGCIPISDLCYQIQMGIPSTPSPEEGSKLLSVLLECKYQDVGSMLRLALVTKAHGHYRQILAQCPSTTILYISRKLTGGGTLWGLIIREKQWELATELYSRRDLRYGDEAIVLKWGKEGLGMAWACRSMNFGTILALIHHRVITERELWRLANRMVFSQIQAALIRKKILKADFGEQGEVMARFGEPEMPGYRRVRWLAHITATSTLLHHGIIRFEDPTIMAALTLPMDLLLDLVELGFPVKPELVKLELEDLLWLEDGGPGMLMGECGLDHERPSYFKGDYRVSSIPIGGGLGPSLHAQSLEEVT